MNTLPVLSETTDLALPDRARNPALAYLGGLAPSGRRAMAWALCKVATAGMGAADLGDYVSQAEREAFVASVPWHKLTGAHVKVIRARLVQELEVGTLGLASVNLCLAALRGVAAACFDVTGPDGRPSVGADELERVRRASKVVKGKAQPGGRALTLAEVGALLDACLADGSPGAVRDAAVIAVMFGTGVRRSELVRLTLADYNAKTGKLKVRGKGRKARTVPVADGARAALADWLAVRGADPGALFTRVSRFGGVDPGKRALTAQAVYNLLHKWAERAKVGAFSPHDLRRTLASYALDQGIDLFVVQHVLGHSRPETTARYDRGAEKRAALAVERIHVPYDPSKRWQRRLPGG